MDRHEHWQQIYRTKAADQFSWFQPVPHRSMELIRGAAARSVSRIIDIGGGDSTLVDAVVREHLGRMTVLDISGAALARAHQRLGPAAKDVTWIESDVTRAVLPPDAYDIWHDRAVFHFLTDADDRARYVERAAASVVQGGTLIVATFAEDGPTRCSGLDCVRYSAASLAETFAPAFVLQNSALDVHRTPSGGEQRFIYAVFTGA